MSTHPSPPVTYPSIPELLDEARQSTGLDDFGSDSFHEGLAVLLDSLATDSGYHDEQAAVPLAVIRRRLVNRLRIEEWYRTHPEVEDEVLAPPVSIVGLPRTGTTAIANVMSIDQQFRSLRMWEQAEPCPPPELATEADDPRRQAQQDEFDAMIRANPDLAAMHLFDVDAAAEDTEVLGLEFKAQQFTLPVRTYHDWWRRCDMTDAYAYHRRVVKLLQSRRPPNLWLFKAPHHKFHFEALVAAYPDIRLVMTHRDPLKSVPSYASLTSALYPPDNRARLDSVYWGRHTERHLREGMEQAVAARDRLGEERFHDVHHTDFVRDPMGTLEAIYAFLGLDLPPATRQAMVTWIDENRSTARGDHRYTLEQYGLDEGVMREQWAFYTKRFLEEP